MTINHNELVFETAKYTLSGVLQGPLYATALVNAMSSGTTTTVGKIVVEEAWQMAEELVARYERELSKSGGEPLFG